MLEKIFILFQAFFLWVFALISRIRKRSERIVSLLSIPFVAAGFAPLIVSLLALLFAFAFALFVLQSNFLPAFLFGFLAVLLDLVDGAVARQQGNASLFGNYLDAVIDKAIDFVLIGSFVFSFPFATVLALGCSFLASFAKPRVALVIITDNRDWPGVGERADKMAVLLAGVLVSAFKPTVFGFNVIEATLFAVALVSLIGVFQRISFAKKLIAEAKRKGNVLPYLKGVMSQKR